MPERIVRLHKRPPKGKYETIGNSPSVTRLKMNGMQISNVTNPLGKRIKKIRKNAGSTRNQIPVGNDSFDSMSLLSASEKKMTNDKFKFMVNQRQIYNLYNQYTKENLKKKRDEMRGKRRSPGSCKDDMINHQSFN